MSAAEEFGVVRLGDRKALAGHHPEAASLLDERVLEAYARFPGGDEDFPALFYLKSGERVCGYFRCIPDELHFDGRTYRWAWTGDNFTEPEFRGRGVSTRLQAMATDWLHARDIGRGSVFSTDVTLRIFEKLGFVLAGHAPRFLLLRSARAVLAAHVAAPLRPVASAVVAPVVAGLSKVVRTRNQRLLHGTVCSTPEAFPHRELDDLFRRVAPTDRVSFATDARLLERKLSLAGRAGVHTLHLVHHGATHTCLAYFILRERLQERPLAGRYRDFRLMTLVDFGLADDEVAAAGIVSAAVSRFFDSTAEVLEVVSSHPLVNREARRRSLRPVGRGMSFTYAVPGAWAWPSDLARPENWPLTHFCGDGFTY